MGRRDGKTGSGRKQRQEVAVAWEWVAPSVTGTMAAVAVGVTLTLDFIRRRREDRIRAAEDARRTVEEERRTVAEALRVLDVVDAVIREYWAEEGTDHSDPIPTARFAWPVADLLRIGAHIQDDQLRERVETAVELVRLHRHWHNGPFPPGAIIFGATQEAREALASWLRTSEVPGQSGIFTALLAFVRLEAEDDAARDVVSSGEGDAPDPAVLKDFEAGSVKSWLSPWRSQR